MSETHRTTIEPDTLVVELSCLTDFRSGASWELRIEDPNGSPVLVADLTLEDFAMLVGSNVSGRKVRGHVITANADHWGKVMEVDRVTITGLDSQTWPDRDAIVADQMADRVSDGWTVDSLGSHFNGHRHDHAADTYQITLRRWVDA